jgi:hypothetical protein
VLFGLGFSLRNGLKGWCNIYLGREDYWGELLWRFVGPAILLGLAAVCGWILLRPLPRDFAGDRFPRANAILWGVLLFQNVIAQLVTGPPWQWNEFVFSLYYVLLFAITGLIALDSSQPRGPRADLPVPSGA